MKNLEASAVRTIRTLGFAPNFICYRGPLLPATAISAYTALCLGRVMRIVKIKTADVLGGSFRFCVLLES